MLVSDKLAILGNLTSYSIRINTHYAIKSRLSFSACVIAMALYNGDLTPLFAGATEGEKISSGGDVDICVPPLAS